MGLHGLMAAVRNPVGIQDDHRAFVGFYLAVGIEVDPHRMISLLLDPRDDGLRIISIEVRENVGRNNDRFSDGWVPVE